MPANKESRWPLCLIAASFFLLGLVVLLQAHYADLNHSIIRGGPRRLDSWQGYIGGVLFWIVGALILSSALRARNRNDI